MTSGSKWFTAIMVTIGAGALLLVAFAIFTLAGIIGGIESSQGEEVTGSGAAVAVLAIDGPIENGEEFIRQLRGYQKRETVKAIVIHINTPGGDPVASHEMYEEIQRVRRSGKPVVASFGSLAASGGYYVACGAQKIVSNPGTLTGSIGVISRFVSLEQLFRKIGMEQTTIASGRFKDLGNPARPMRDDEKAYFQSVVNDLHQQFVDIVATSRHLSVDTVNLLADGRVFTGRQAKLHGLVDTLGSLRTAVLLAASLAGISGEPRVIQQRKRESLIDQFVGQTVHRTVQELRSQGEGGNPFHNAYSMH